MTTLTPAQSKVLDFMALHIVQRQRPPSRFDICAHFGWTSDNAAECHMVALERKGFISLEASARGSQTQRYPRIVRWPDNVLPVLQFATTD